MSKSKGEFLTISLLESKGYDPLAYRYLCLTSHYRKQLTFSYEILDNAVMSYQKLKTRVQNLARDGEIDKTVYSEFDQKFKEYLSDDLNIANALSLVYDLLKSEVNDVTKYTLIRNWDQVFSLDLTKEKEVDPELEAYILQKIEERALAKKNKDFAKADQIREELLKQNIVLKDTREKTIYTIL